MATTIGTAIVSARVVEAEGYSEKRTALAYDYVVFLEQLGFFVVVVPCNTENVAAYFKLLPKLVVLTGGNTIEGKQSVGGLSGLYPERDRLEESLVDEALALNIPILGICRGMQFLNKYFGGDLVNNITGHVGNTHSIRSQMDILDGATINSYHNDGILKEQVARELNIVAWSEDGIVEAVSMPRSKVLGLQWHPERQQERYDSYLVTELLGS